MVVDGLEIGKEAPGGGWCGDEGVTGGNPVMVVT